jgi:two-component system response regulator AtoC
MILAEHFLERSNEKFGKNVEFDNETREYIMQNPWPGNVRELQNAISRYVVLGKLGSGFEIDVRPSITPVVVDEKFVDVLSPDSPHHREDREPGVSTQTTELTHPHEGMTLKEISRNAARQAERKAILTVLEATGWNRSQAAKILKISYKALLYKIKDCGIDRNAL